MPNRMISEVIAGQILQTANDKMTVLAAAKAMVESKVGSLLIVDDQGNLDGIFTERDALFRVIAKGIDPATTPLSEVMTTKLQTITADRPLGHALHLMYEGGFRHVPVVDGSKPVGMISARDALGGELTQFEAELHQRDDIAEIL
ncbi:MAG: CBS domain-containing protein [Zoogloeaceae bacterium]|nr:CBS domain-containing protein [Zoogloeaceae bacterium]